MLVLVLIFTAYYTTISGLWGVLVTDLFQFVLKMGMVIALAVWAVKRSAASIRSRPSQRARCASGNAGSRLAFLPGNEFHVDAANNSVVYLGVNWWATWYPGAEPRRRRLCCATNFFGEKRATRCRNFVVQCGTLRAAAVALGIDRAGDYCPLPATCGQRSGYIKVLMDPTYF